MVPHSGDYPCQLPLARGKTLMLETTKEISSFRGERRSASQRWSRRTQLLGSMSRAKKCSICQEGSLMAFKRVLRVVWMRNRGVSAIPSTSGLNSVRVLYFGASIAFYSLESLVGSAVVLPWGIERSRNLYSFHVAVLSASVNTQLCTGQCLIEM